MSAGQEDKTGDWEKNISKGYFFIETWLAAYSVSNIQMTFHLGQMLDDECGLTVIWFSDYLLPNWKPEIKRKKTQFRDEMCTRVHVYFVNKVKDTEITYLFSYFSLFS